MISTGMSTEEEIEKYGLQEANYLPVVNDVSLNKRHRQNFNLSLFIAL